MSECGITKIICITCPIGCHLEVEQTARGELKVTGNKCPRGDEYAREECTAPKRVVTATCLTSSSEYPRIPVKTDGALPMELIGGLLKKLYSLKVELPLERGDVILKDYSGTGVNIVASKSMK